MKKVFLGLVLGIVLCAIAGYIMLPGIKKTAYDSGYNTGNKEGIASGTTAGIAKGIADIEARQKQQRDSIATVQANLAAKRKALQKPRKVAPPIQNWHVVDGKIAEPVIEQAEEQGQQAL
jgi:hypothetical protein